MDNLRDSDEWRREGLPMSSTSNDACKMFDACLRQLIRWREDEQLGGIGGTLERMFSADANFVLGHVFKNGIEMMGESGAFSDVYYDRSMNELVRLGQSQAHYLTEREKNHIRAMVHFHQGNIDRSCNVWENILIEHPTDMLALKFLNDSYFYMGQSIKMRDSLARVIPFWNKTLPLYSSLFSMYAFGLGQSNFIEESRRMAQTSLDLDPTDAWATHAMSHYYEYRNEPHNGIDFLARTEANWCRSNIIANHNYWHWALHHIENGEHQLALDMFEQHASANLNSKRVIDLVDCVSLYYRLKLDGYEIGAEKWADLTELFKHRIKYHGFCFNDAFTLMMLSGSGRTSREKFAFFSSLDEYLINDDNMNSDLVESRDTCNNIVHGQESHNYLKEINQNLGVGLFTALARFDDGNYQDVVDQLYPIRYELYKIGGSNAQRDLFHQMLTHAAFRSTDKLHNKLALALLNERLALKPNSHLNKRLANRYNVTPLYKFDPTKRNSGEWSFLITEI